MNFLLTLLIKSIILFVQNTYGVVASPYKTYRRLAESQHVEQLLPLVGLVVLYFWWESAVRKGIFAYPLLFAKSWMLHSVVAGFTFVLTIVGIFVVGRMLKGHGSIKNIILPWGYSLLPTLFWFFVTSFSYFILPPPRHPSLAGKLFSFLFIVGSMVLFLWKGILYYLTLRFGMRLDLWRILAATAIIFPAGILYSIIMYKLGIFRIPFI